MRSGFSEHRRYFHYDSNPTFNQDVRRFYYDRKQRRFFQMNEQYSSGFSNSYAGRKHTQEFWSSLGDTVLTLLAIALSLFFLSPVFAPNFSNKLKRLFETLYTPSESTEMNQDPKDGKKTEAESFESFRFSASLLQQKGVRNVVLLFRTDQLQFARSVILALRDAFRKDKVKSPLPERFEKDHLLLYSIAHQLHPFLSFSSSCSVTILWTKASLDVAGLLCCVVNILCV